MEYKKVTVSIYIPESLQEDIDQIALKEKRSFSYFAQEGLERMVNLYHKKYKNI